MGVKKRHNKWWVDFCFNRARYRRPSPDNSKAGAIAYEVILRQKLARGVSIHKDHESISKVVKFKEFAQEWFENYVLVNSKPSDIRGKKSILRSSLVPFFGEYQLHEIGSLEIEKYKAGKIKEGKSHKTINNHLAVIGKCLRTAQDWEIMEKIPKIKPLKVPPQKFDFLTPEESEKLLAIAHGIWKDLIVLALNTGMRFGEMIGLTRKEINLEEQFLIVKQSVVVGKLGSPKNNKIRHIPMTDEVVKMFRERLVNSKHQFIFCAESGNFLKNENTLVSLHLICKKAGIRNIGWHTMRHTFASRLAANNIPIIAIKELLGHSDVKMTMRYAHLGSLELRRAVMSLEKPKPIENCHYSVTDRVSQEKTAKFFEK